jgi:hypothetical protein
VSENPFSALFAGNPAFTDKATQFMMLRDAAEVLGVLKPPHHEIASEYLREVADHLMRDAGVPEEFLQVMIKSRPSVTEMK